MFLEFKLNFWDRLKEAVPWLLFGYLVTILINIFDIGDGILKKEGEINMFSTLSGM